MKIASCLLLLLSSLVVIKCQTFPYVSFMGQTLANHSYVNLSLVGNNQDGSDSVQCHTNLATCCSLPQGIHRGDWYFPNGQQLPFSGNVHENRTALKVHLWRTSGNSPSGVYRCDIPTVGVHDDGNISVRHTVYVGLYSSNGGEVSISGDITSTVDSDLHGESPQFTLTCISTGGPATTVTWTRDSTTVTKGTKTVLNDPVTAQYTHTMTGNTAGVHMCTVENNKPSSSSATFTVIGASPPTNVTAVQNGATSIRVSWTPPSPLGHTTGYTISLTGSSNNDTVTVTGGESNSVTLAHLNGGDTYTVSIVGMSTGLLSAAVQAVAVGLVPFSAPLLSSTVTAADTSIAITGSVPSDSVVTGFVVKWQRDNASVGCSNVDHRSIHVDGAFTSYNITGLEPGNRYRITVRASNTAGTGPASDPVNAMTDETAPSGPPASISPTNITANTIVIHWEEVTCLDRNGNVTGYSVTARQNGAQIRKFYVTGDTREATISGLTLLTVYTLQVAAFNNAGSGPLIGIDIETEDKVTISVSPTTTSLTVSWMLEQTLSASTYTISYQRTDSSCATTISDNISGSDTSYTLTDLEEGTEYSVTLTATFTGGQGTGKDNLTVSTTDAAPSAPPLFVKVRVESSISITVQWGSMDCRHRNGEIVGYSVRYGEEGSGEGGRREEIVSGDSSGRRITISGLTQGTVYTVEVAAQTSAGTGVYSRPQTIETPDYVHVSLNGDIIRNHGYVVISDIGTTDKTALLCHTNLSPPPGRVNSGGDWYAPDGTRVNNADVPGFTRNRGPMLVRLFRYPHGDLPQEGVYNCSIEDATSTYREVYVGLYNRGNGNITLTTLAPHLIISGAIPQFTLTCISTGGPATTVTWSKSGSAPVLITQGTECLYIQETAQYNHTVNVSAAGEYVCNVANSAFSASATITLQGVSQPSNVTSVQDGPTSILVSWSPSGEATGYRITYFTSGGDGGSTDIGGSTISLGLSGLVNGLTYTVSIIATSETLPASASITNQVTLVPAPEKPIVEMDKIMATTSSISLFWIVPPNTTSSEVSWEMTGAVSGTDSGSSGRITENKYNITDLGSGTSYEITVTIFNPAGNSSSSFTHSTTKDCACEETAMRVIAALIGVLAVVVLTAAVLVAVLGVVIVVLLRRPRKAKVATNEGLELSSTSGKAVEKLNTSKNEAYKEVKETGRGEVPEEDYAPSTSPQLKAKVAGDTEDSIYENM